MRRKNSPQRIQTEREIPAEVKASLVNDGRTAETAGEFSFSVQFGRISQNGTKIQQKQNFQIHSEEFEILATMQLVNTPAFAAIYQNAKLDHPATLEKAIESAAFRLYKYHLTDVVQQSILQSGDLLAVVLWGNTVDIHQRLEQPEAMMEIRSAYRDLLHRRSLIAIQASLEVFKQARERDLASPSLYLDAAMCYATLHEDAESQMLIFEAIEKYKDYPAPEFFLRAGKILQLVGDEKGQAKAQKLLDTPTLNKEEKL